MPFRKVHAAMKAVAEPEVPDFDSLVGTDDTKAWLEAFAKILKLSDINKVMQEQGLSSKKKESKSAKLKHLLHKFQLELNLPAS